MTPMPKLYTFMMKHTSFTDVGELDGVTSSATKSIHYHVTPASVSQMRSYLFWSSTKPTLWGGGRRRRGGRGGRGGGEGRDRRRGGEGERGKEEKGKKEKRRNERIKTKIASLGWLLNYCLKHSAWYLSSTLSDLIINY